MILSGWCKGDISYLNLLNKKPSSDLETLVIFLPVRPLMVLSHFLLDNPDWDFNHLNQLGLITTGINDVFLKYPDKYMNKISDVSPTTCTLLKT